MKINKDSLVKANELLKQKEDLKRKIKLFYTMQSPTVSFSIRDISTSSSYTYFSAEAKDIGFKESNLIINKCRDMLIHQYTEICKQIKELENEE